MTKMRCPSGPVLATFVIRTVSSKKSGSIHEKSMGLLFIFDASFGKRCRTVSILDYFQPIRNPKAPGLNFQAHFFVAPSV